MSKYKEIDTSRTIIVGSGLEVVYVIYYSILASRKKIGMAADQSLGVRMSQFVQTGAPSPLVVELIILTNSASSLEKILHTRLREYRVRGEWFDIPCLSHVIDVNEFGEIASPTSPQAEIFTLRQELRHLSRKQEDLLAFEGQIYGRIEALYNRIEVLADHIGIRRHESQSYGEFLRLLRAEIESLFWKEKQINDTKKLLQGWEKKIDIQQKEIMRLKQELETKESQMKDFQEREAQNRRRWRITRPFGT